MIRQALRGDIPALQTFLTRHADRSMFLRSNLDLWQSGPDPAACEFWLDERAETVVGVVGLTSGGYGLVQCPDGIDWTSVRALLGPRQIIGLSGAGDQVAPALAGLGLAGQKAMHDSTEPLMTLALGDLSIPDGRGALRALTPDDAERLTEWRAAFMHEIMGMRDLKMARRVAAEQVPAMIAGGRMRFLTEDDRVLAMAGFNARTRERVQLGSVYTPPALRGQGHARRLVALHLAEAEAGGAERAVLFAANDPARRAYEAIGFREIGTYRMVILAEPATCAVPS